MRVEGEDEPKDVENDDLEYNETSQKLNKWNQDDVSSKDPEPSERSKVPQFPDITKQEDCTTLGQKLRRDSLEEESFNAAELIKHLNIN